jgi:hypothetical protein
MSAFTQERLAAIEGLTLADCLQFFHEKATPEQRKIAEMVEVSDEGFERDYDIVSEGADNGAYVLGWRWVSFSGTDMDIDAEDEGEDE